MASNSLRGRERHDARNNDGPRWLTRQHLARYEWAAAMVADKVVVDAACGTGYGSAMLARAGAKKVIGVDLAAEAMERAGTYIRHGLEFVLGSVTDLPFPDATFDVYVSFETIEHVEDDEAFLREARRVIKPEGMLLLSTPNRLLTNPRLPPQGKPFNRYHVREYTRDELLDLVAKYFSSCEVFAQAPFSKRFCTFLNHLPLLWKRFPARVHQTVKLLLELTGRFPDCCVRPGPVTSSEESEVLLLRCRASDA
ncbi:MAG: class I SAM-dependent methyltransferase [Thermogutta sp.]